MRPSDKQVRNRKLGVYKPVVFNKKSRDDFNLLFKKLELKNVPLYVYELRVIYTVDEKISFELPFKFRGREYEVVADDLNILYVKALKKIAELQGNF